MLFESYKESASTLFVTDSALDRNSAAAVVGSCWALDCFARSCPVVAVVGSCWAPVLGCFARSCSAAAVVGKSVLELDCFVRSCRVPTLDSPGSLSALADVPSRRVRHCRRALALNSPAGRSVVAPDYSWVLVYNMHDEQRRKTMHIRWILLLVWSRRRIALFVVGLRIGIRYWSAVNDYHHANT